jgi:hypothetical protein
MRRTKFFIIENSNYTIEYLERISIFEFFAISEIVEQKLQKKIEMQEELEAQNIND